MDGAQGGTPGKAMLLLGLIFVLGMVAGASLFYMGQRSVGPPPRPEDRPGPPRAGQGPEGRPPREPLEDMTDRLGLSDEQRRDIREILDTYRDRMDDMLEESRSAIREVLTEDQRRRFDTMRPPRPEDRLGPPPPRPGGRRKGPPPHRRP